MIAKRYENNPILTPNKNQSWEAEAVFNGCPIQKGNTEYMALPTPVFWELHLDNQEKEILFAMKMNTEGFKKITDTITCNKE